MTAFSVWLTISIMPMMSIFLSFELYMLSTWIIFYTIRSYLYVVAGSLSYFQDCGSTFWGDLLIDILSGDLVVLKQSAALIFSFTFGFAVDKILYILTSNDQVLDWNMFYYKPFYLFLSVDVLSTLFFFPFPTALWLNGLYHRRTNVNIYFWVLEQCGQAIDEIKIIISGYL